MRKKRWQARLIAATLCAGLVASPVQGSFGRAYAGVTEKEAGTAENKKETDKEDPDTKGSENDGETGTGSKESGSKGDPSSEGGEQGNAGSEGTGTVGGQEGSAEGSGHTGKEEGSGNTEEGSGKEEETGDSTDEGSKEEGKGETEGETGKEETGEEETGKEESGEDQPEGDKTGDKDSDGTGNADPGKNDNTGKNDDAGDTDTGTEDDQTGEPEKDGSESAGKKEEDQLPPAKDELTNNREEEKASGEEAETEPELRERAEDEVFQIEGQEGYYKTLQKAVEALTDDGQTITLLEDAKLGSWDGSIKYSFTLTSEGSAILTADKQLELASNSNTDVRDVRFENIAINITAKNDSIRIGKNIHLTLGEGTKLSSETGNAIRGEYIGLENADQVGLLTMEEGSLITNSNIGIYIGGIQAGDLNIVMEEGAEISGCEQAMVVDRPYKYVSDVDIRGAIINNVSTVPFGFVGGLELNEGNIHISGSARITGNMMTNEAGEKVPGNISLGKNVVLDLTDLGEDAALGLTIPNAKPTGDGPVLLAELNPDWAELPEGITLDDENSPYQLSLGTSKLETGRLYLIDPEGKPSILLDGNGTEMDPFLVDSYEKLKAAVDKANLRSAMTYVQVDDAIEFPENEKLLLSGKLTLYSDKPENTVLSTQKGMFYIAGKAEIVLHDIHLQGSENETYSYSAITYDDRVSGSVPTGTITIQNGTIIKGFAEPGAAIKKSAAINLEDCSVDIIMTGGEIINCDNAFLTEGKIELKGGRFSDLNTVVNLYAAKAKVEVGSAVQFANNEYDFIVSQASRNLLLTGPFDNKLKLKLADEIMTGAILTAEDASYLEGWEEKITVSDGRGNSYSLKRSEDGKQLLLQGGETAIRFEKSELEGKYYSYDFDTQKRVSTGTSFIGDKGVNFTYNGYGLSVEITKAKLSKPIDGLTNEDGYITNWESPDLELRASVDGELVKATVTRDNEKQIVSIDGIPANWEKQPRIYLYYTGNDTYSPALANIITFDYFRKFDVLTGTNQKIDGLDLSNIENSSVPYTGKEAFPDGGVITVTADKLKDGKPVTLKLGEDYQFNPIKGKNCTDVGSAYANLEFIGNYGKKGYSYEVEYKISKATDSLKVQEYHVAVEKGKADESIQIAIDELKITPEQASADLKFAAVDPDSTLTEEIKQTYFTEIPQLVDNGALLKFTLKKDAQAGELVIPVTVESKNGTGTGNIIVNITEETADKAVELRPDGNTDHRLFFDSMTEAWPYVKEGGNPVIIMTGKAQADGLTLDKPVTIYGKEKDSAEPVDRIGSLTGSFTLADPNIVIQNTDLSKAEIKLATEKKEIQNLTENYWGEDGPYQALKEGLKGVSRDKVFPYYKDAAMTQPVNDPEEYFEEAIDQANALIEAGKLNKLLSLLDLQNKKEDPEVESFLWSKKGELTAIIKGLEEADKANKGELQRYLKYNEDAQKEYDMLYWAYSVSCAVVSEASAPDAEGAGSNAQTEAGRTAVETAKQELAENSVVKDYLPVLGIDGPEAVWDAVKKAAGADADKIEAIYLKASVSAKQIMVDESLERPEINQLQFAVEAQYRTRNADETRNELEKKEWQTLPEEAAGEVTFRLPIPSSVTKPIAVVKQDGMADRELEIKEENGSKYVELTVSKFGSLSVAFQEKSSEEKPEEKPDQETDRSSGSGSGSSSTIRNNGTWHQDNIGWWFAKTGGGYPAGQWYECYWNGEMHWYHFNAQGYLDAGWFTDKDGATYYLHNLHDNQFGYMYTGWNWIDGKCYYFTQNTIAGGPKQGMLYRNGITPDGYSVNETGAWTVNGAVQTK